MNSILKRTGGVVIIIISALVLLSSVGGVVGLWALQGAMQDLTVAVFSPLESGVNTANQALTKVDARINTARDRVSNAQEFVGQLGQNVGNGPVLNAISNTLNTRLGPEVDAAQESIGNAIDLVNGVNNSIVALNRLPGVDLPTLTNQLEAIESRLTSLRDRMQALRADLEAMVQGRLQVTSARLNAALEEVDSGLQSVQSLVNEQTGNTQQIQARLDTLKSDISQWISIGWIVGTLFLLWIAVSQVAMLLYGWSLLRSKPKDLAVPAAPTSPSTPSTPTTGEDLTSTAT